MLTPALFPSMSVLMPTMCPAVVRKLRITIYVREALAMEPYKSSSRLPSSIFRHDITTLLLYSDPNLCSRSDLDVELSSISSLAMPYLCHLIEPPPCLLHL